MRFSFVVPVVLAAGVLLAPVSARATVSPPPPTGIAAVGFTRTTLVDHTRTEHLAAEAGGPRLIPLRVWYPATRPGRLRGAVLSPAEQAGYESEFGLPPDALGGMGDTSTQDAPAAPGSHPVLLLSHGFGLSTAFHVAHATELASRGYVVIGIDHPGDADLVDVGGGTLEHMSPRGIEIRDESLVERVADERFVVDHLGAIRGAGVLSRTRIGALGHSIGGTTAANAMLGDRRIRAGVDMDGAMFGPVVETGLDRPFGVLIGELPLPAYEGLAAFTARLRAPHPFERQGTTGHQAFTDIVWMVPQLGADPSAFALGTVDPATAVSGQRAFLDDFFDRYVADREGRR